MCVYVCYHCHVFSTGPKEDDRVRGCYGDALWCLKGENKLMRQMEESSDIHQLINFQYL